MDMEKNFCSQKVLEYINCNLLRLDISYNSIKNDLIESEIWAK